MTAAAPLDDDADDDGFDYGFGEPGIDAAVRYWADRLPDPTPLQRAQLNALFNRN